MLYCTTAYHTTTIDNIAGPTLVVRDVIYYAIELKAQEKLTCTRGLEVPQEDDDGSTR